ncbi:NAD(P)-binding protein [Auricularia subglabra TFB-10046 SS5]|nr:NAD(P)-binding protein [Auricularia subglabra TFB-10046 SS5]
MSPRVLLTGASGFIAAHVLDQLLKQGYWVRATVRSEAKKQDILAANAAYASQLDFAIVPDIATKGAFDDAVKAEPALDYIIHTASPFHFNPQDVLKDMLEPAVQGTLGVLEAAHKYAPSVKRIVVTSSFASILDPATAPGPAGKIYTEEDWNPITWEQSQSNNYLAYIGSKKFAEKAAWDFVEREKPGFELIVLNPPMVFGPIINAQSLKSLNTSNAAVYAILSGERGAEIPPTGVHLWVDVRDLASAHVIALTAAGAGNNRFLVKADGEYSNQEIADILRKLFPVQPVPLGTPGTGLAPDVYQGDNAKSKKLLGLEYKRLEETLADLGKSLISLAK